MMILELILDTKIKLACQSRFKVDYIISSTLYFLGEKLFYERTLRIR